MKKSGLEKYKKKAHRILKALENGGGIIDWPKIEEPELIDTIANELFKMDREDQEKELQRWIFEKEVMN